MITCEPSTQKRIIILKSNQNDKEDKEPEYTMIGVGVAIGTAVGVALGAAMDNIGIGIAIGIAMGAAIGSALQQQKKTNK